MSARTTPTPNHPPTSRPAAPPPHDLVQTIQGLARITGRNTRTTFERVIDAILYQLSAQPPHLPDPITQFARDVDYVAESYLRRTIGRTATSLLTRIHHSPGLLQDTHHALGTGDDRPPRQVHGPRTTTPLSRTAERKRGGRPGIIAVNPSHARLIAKIRTFGGSNSNPSGQTEPAVVVVEESDVLQAKLCTIVVVGIQTSVQGVIRVNASTDRPPVYEVKPGAGPPVAVHPRPRH